MINLLYIVALCVTVLGLALTYKDGVQPSYCDVRREAMELDRQERNV